MLEAKLILFPAFAMFALVTVVLLRMRSLRFAAMRRGEVDVRFFRSYQDGGQPESLRVIERHFSNLFEVPVLFHIGVLMAYVTAQVSWPLLVLAWSYVAARCVHSAIHLGSNSVMARFVTYMLSNVLLLAMWLLLLYAVIRS